MLQIFSAAESLTDEVAKSLYALSPIEGVSADLFVSALHYSDLVTPRNSEWHIVAEARNDLYRKLLADKVNFEKANQVLFKLSESGDRKEAGSKIPSYVFTAAGKAYHATALGHKDAISLYSHAAEGRLSGAQWLAAKLAEEQEQLEIIPRGAIEPAFLRGMVLYREGKRAEAEPYLRRVIAHGGRRHEAAVAMHLVGLLVQRRNLDEAEKLYRQSLEILGKLGDRHGEAQVMHSLANLIGRRNPEEAEKLYRQSLEIALVQGDRFSEAQRLHSLANLIGRRNPEEAEKLYRDSWKIGQELGNRHHEAQTMHSLANLIGRRNPEEAEKLLRQSLQIGRDLGNRNHQAQTLRSLGLLLADKSPREAEAALKESLDINIKARNRQGEAIVRRSLDQFYRQRKK